ncbi:hypothetical protein BG015_001927 [Linnemannia schmuckeri]|uniref:Uncharacterized protein n=1 Tax=Linnemannia schmuckeri TaxID=64567 RepID=A0A9P5RP47_9FUNG|nr:hypothetical protein BG015_001927 [Linnemannia schmuckeri]
MDSCMPTITFLQGSNPRQSRRRQHHQHQQQHQRTDINEHRKQHAKQYQHLSQDNNKNNKDKMLTMHSIKRSPCLKLVAAVAVNVGFVLICQQYWKVTGDNSGIATGGVKGGDRSRSLLERILIQEYVPEEVHLTHDVAIPYDIPVWTAADSAALRTAMGYDMMSDLLQPEYSVHEEVIEKSQLDFARTSRAERVYKSLWDFLRPVYDSLPGETSAEREHAFVKELAPKRHSEVTTEPADPVIPLGEGDLSRERQELGGWSIKAFSLLASRFEEAMFVDSDAYFLQDPAKLFEDPGYNATGGLFFYDRTLFPDWHTGLDWMRSMVPIMSTLPNQLRSFKGLSTYKQESGVVVINKKARLNGLLVICSMNSKWERDLHSYKVLYGNKETFWVGFEIVQEPYSFMRTYGGDVGEL